MKYHLGIVEAKDIYGILFNASPSSELYLFLGKTLAIPEEYINV